MCNSGVYDLPENIQLHSLSENEHQIPNNPAGEPGNITSLKYGRWRQRKGIESNCDEKLHCRSIIEQLHGGWAIWEEISTSTCSNEDTPEQASGVPTLCCVTNIPSEKQTENSSQLRVKKKKKK